MTSPHKKELYPGAVWSLWDMLLAYGHLLTNLIDRIDTAMALAQRDPNGTAQKNIATGSMADPAIDMILQTAGYLAKELKMRPVGDQVGHLNQLISFNQSLNEIGLELWNLRVQLQRELRRKEFLAVSEDLAEFYKDKDPFKLGSKFKKAQSDVQSAARCLAVGEPIACVFHLMRAMEVAVRELSNRRKVKITPKSTWRQMTGEMDNKIKAMPEDTAVQKRKKNNWEEARANLHHVGSVWRNNTMHPATSYTVSQAKDVFHYCGLFMQNLCDL